MKPKSIIIFCVTLILIGIACHQFASNNQTIQSRDTSIKKNNSFTGLFFDSLALENFIESQQIQDSVANEFRNFYNGRNYQYAWFFPDGLAEQAHSFWNMQSDYISYSGDSSIYNVFLQKLMDAAVANNDSVNLNDNQRLSAELSLTQQFFKYASNAYQGDKQLNTDDLQWFIPRKKINMVSFLDSLVYNKGKNVDEYEPANKQYNLLKDYLVKYSKLEKQDEWTTITSDQKKFENGSRSPAIVKIKKRLTLTGDYKAADTTTLFTDSLQMAVKNFQKRYGMKEDGVIGPGVLKELNQPIRFRIQQILINLERIRWAPEESKKDYLLVNIPSFKLYVYEDGKYNFDMNVVVGKAGHNTVVFSGNLKYVVFSPYWSVPSSIVKNEIMPGMRRNPNYLARRNMEIVSRGGGVPVIRQRPGAYNSLGKVKFLFPNNYNIYLHDTPSKGLFSEDSRAFSHGCIRLGEPARLAQFLLRGDTTWTDEKIQKAMNSGKEQYVTLKEPVQVFIGYFTAFVDREGQINFRNDVYGHDERMRKMMFK